MNARSRRWVWLYACVCLLPWSVGSTAAIDELELIVDGGASSFPTPAAYGPAAQVAGQYWEFTDGTGNQTGGITYVDLPVSDVWSVTGQFWTGLGSGGVAGGDAFYVYAWATGDPTTEHSAHGQYSIAYDEFDEEIQLHYDGVTLASVPQTGMASETWRSFQVDCIEGAFGVYLDGALKLSYDDGPNFYGRVGGNRFGFGGRDATATNVHRVKGMAWNATTSADTSALAVITEGGAPTFPVGTAFGSAVDAGAAWQLNPAVVGAHGGVKYSSLGLTERFDLTGEFRSGGGTGADMFYVFLWADAEPNWQSHAVGQYAVSFDELNEQIKLIYNGATLAFFGDSTLGNGQWRTFQVSCDTGVFDVQLDGSLVLTHDDSANFLAQATGTLSGFAGGSGSITNGHQVRNMVATVGPASTPAIVWAAPFLRQAYDGVADYSAITDGVIQSDTSLTVETWFRTNTHGVILGYQADSVGAAGGNYTPAVYVGTDGLLRGMFWSEDIGPGPITSAGTVNDGLWHHVALLGDDDQSTLYLDGALVGVAPGGIHHLSQTVNQIGTGHTLSWPAGNGTWHYFGGEIGGFHVWDGPVSSADVGTMAAAPPAMPAVAWSISTDVVTTYDGVDDYTAGPDNLIQSRVAMTVETWFRTTETRGGLFGMQSEAYPPPPSPAAFVPSMYVASDGRLAGALWIGLNPPPYSPSAVNDGGWHHAALVGDVDRHHFYVDGAFVNTYVAPITDAGMNHNQVGLALSGWVGGTGTWDFFRGDIADFSVWDGTLTSAEVASIAAAAPTAPVPSLTASLAGGADYLDVGADTSLELAGEYTLEAWIRPTGGGINPGNAGSLISREGEYLIAWWPTDTMVRYAVGNHTTNPFQWRDTGYTTPVGVWRHLALTSSATDGTIRLYADGVEVYTENVAGAMSDFSASDNTRFGERQDVAESFDGDMDEIRIWNVARSAGEIRSTYLRTLSADEAAAATGLVGYWNFDDGTTTDLSVNTNAGTFFGNSGILGSQQTFGANATTPLADSIAISAVNGAMNTIAITGSDGDEDYLTFSLPELASGDGVALTLIDDNPLDNTADVQYTPTVNGPDSFAFTVTDGIETSSQATVTITVSDPTDFAASFDGAADYVNAGPGESLIMTAAFTLEAWVLPMGIGDPTYGGTIMCREGEYIVARFPDSSVQFAIANATSGYGWVDTGYDLPLDVWTHVAVTYDSATGDTKTYADGVLVTTVGGSGTIGDTDQDRNSLWIGDREFVPQGFDGRIDEVRVWNVARQAREIANTYDRTLSAVEAQTVPGLVGYWNFNNVAADGVVEDIAATNDGVFVGNATTVGSAQILASNIAPTATPNLTASVVQGQTAQIPITGSDPDEDLLSFTLLGSESGSPLTLVDESPTDNLATVTYTPSGGTVEDTISFEVSDGTATSSVETVAITVTPPVDGVSASTLVVQPGESVVMPIHLGGVSGVTEIELTVSYNTSVVTLDSLALGTAAFGGLLTHTGLSDPMTISLSDLQDIVGGEIARMGISVLPNASFDTDYPVTLSSPSLNGSPATLTLADGALKIVGIAKGDVTGNGDIEAADAQETLELIATAGTVTDPSLVSGLGVQTSVPWGGAGALLPGGRLAGSGATITNFPTTVLNTHSAFAVADVDEDGSIDGTTTGLVTGVTALDAANMLRFAVGQITVFPNNGPPTAPRRYGQELCMEIRRRPQQ